MILKFGKFKGSSLEDIVNMPEGQQYLEWLRDNTETTGKYAKQNRQLIAEITEVIGAGGGESAPVAHIAAPRPMPSSGGSATLILQQIAATLKSIEKILANPKQLHIAETEMTADEDIPF